MAAARRRAVRCGASAASKRFRRRRWPRPGGTRGKLVECEENTALLLVKLLPFTRFLWIFIGKKISGATILVMAVCTVPTKNLHGIRLCTYS